MAFFRGGRKRGNPALEEKRMRQGEKETHNFMLWEKIEDLCKLWGLDTSNHALLYCLVIHSTSWVSVWVDTRI